MTKYICIEDSNSIKELKSLERKEHELILGVIERENNSADELLGCVASANLLEIASEYHQASHSSVGYKLGVNAAEMLSSLYNCLLPVKHFLVKESDKISTTHQLDDISEELRKTTLLINDIMQEISKLLTCEDFVHSIDISYGGESSDVFVKKLVLKRYSSSIPNPHQIPLAYKTIVGSDQREVYKMYSNFANYFACNWVVAIKRLSKIKKAFNDIHNLCPLVRLTIMQAILVDFELNDLPSDIMKSFATLDPQALLRFHASYLVNLIYNCKNKNTTPDLLWAELSKISELLRNPMKNVIHFNIIMNSTIKSMMMMIDLQKQNALDPQHQQTLQNIENFFSKVSKKHNTTVDELLSISHTISVERWEKKQQSSDGHSYGVSL